MVAKCMPEPCSPAGPKAPQQAQSTVAKRFQPRAAPGFRPPCLVNPAVAKHGVPLSAVTGTKLPRPVSPVVVKHTSESSMSTEPHAPMQTRPAGTKSTLPRMAPKPTTRPVSRPKSGMALKYMEDLQEVKRQIEMSTTLSQRDLFSDSASILVPSTGDGNGLTINELLLATVSHLTQLHWVGTNPMDYVVSKYRHAVLMQVESDRTNCSSNATLASTHDQPLNPARLAQVQIVRMVYNQPLVHSFWRTSFHRGTASWALIAITANLAHCKAIHGHLS